VGFVARRSALRKNRRFARADVIMAVEVKRDLARDRAGPLDPHRWLLQAFNE
jgi:hypothetical protein